MRRAVIYCRTASAHEANDLSLEAQAARCRTYCADHDYEVLEVIIDAGQSGARLERPGLTRVRELVATGQADAVVIERLDRLSRSLPHLLLLTDELSAAKAALYVVVRGSPQDAPAHSLMDTIATALAEYERLRIVERLKRKANPTATVRE